MKIIYLNYFLFVLVENEFHADRRLGAQTPQGNCHIFFTNFFNRPPRRLRGAGPMPPPSPKSVPASIIDVIVAPPSPPLAVLSGWSLKNLDAG